MQPTVRLENLALPLRNAVDPSGMDLMGSAKEALPTCDRVCADDGAALLR